jgi:hypothetical protein
MEFLPDGSRLAVVHDQIGDTLNWAVRVSSLMGWTTSPPSAPMIVYLDTSG